MEAYYRMHWQEFGNIEILMICSPNGVKLKDIMLRIITKLNESRLKMGRDMQGSKESWVQSEVDLKKMPTVIAFQFNPNKMKKAVRVEGGRKAAMATAKAEE